MMFPQLKLGTLCQKYTSSQLAYLSIGISLGISISLASLFALTVDVVELASSWMAELFTFFIILGGFAAGMLMQHHGRVPVIEFATLILSFGWAVTCLCEMAFVLLYVGSAFIAGALGMMAPTLCVYVIETHPLETNERLITAAMHILIGISMSFLFVLFLHWKLTLFLLQAFTLLAYFSLRYHVLDSPLWLCSKKRFEEASSAFKHLGQGLTDNCADRNALESRYAALRPDREGARISQFKLFCYIFLQQVTSNHLLYYYVVKVAIPVDVSATIAYVLLSVIPSLVLRDASAGPARRRASLTPTIVVCITYLMAAAYESKLNEAEDVSLFLHTCALLNCSFGYFCGLYSLPWIMTVENVPSETRGFLTSILWLTNYLIVRFWLHTYQLTMPFVEGCGISIVFLMMAFVTVLFHLYLWTEPPEEKSLLEVEMKVVQSDNARRSGTNPV